MKVHAERFQALVREALREVSEISCQDALNEQRDGTSLLIDVREESEFAAGAIPGAMHLGKGVIERDIEFTVPDLSRRIVLYCGGGYRSALAAKSLSAMGYEQVLSMAGGYRGYKELIERDGA